MPWMVDVHCYTDHHSAYIHYREEIMSKLYKYTTAKLISPTFNFIQFNAYFSMYYTSMRAAAASVIVYRRLNELT